MTSSSFSSFGDSGEHDEHSSSASVVVETTYHLAHDNSEQPNTANEDEGDLPEHMRYIASLKSVKQSQQYLPNEIEDDLGASAISLALTSSMVTTSNMHVNSFKQNSVETKINMSSCHDEYQNSSVKRSRKK